MRICAVLPAYPPASRVGSWLTTHEWLAPMTADHQVDVVTTSIRGTSYTLDGVTVHGFDRRTLAALVAEADVVVAHLGDNGHGPMWARRHGKPLIRVVHSGPHPSLPAEPFEHLCPTALAVFPSDACRRSWGYDGHHVVVNPPIDPNRYRTRPGAVTLVNLSEQKGGVLFWALTRQLRHVEFLGVVGGYGVQTLPAGAQAALIAGVEDAAPNVKVIPNQDDPRTVYARTRVLLVPSESESYGRVAVEAMCSGIPVIAHPSPGLREACGDAAIWCDRDNLDDWAAAVESLEDLDTWARWSAAATDRAAQLDPGASVAGFSDALTATIGVAA